MKYTIPDYYRSFRCIATDCPATCCAGWQIVIDDKTIKKYRNCRTPFGSRLANSIDWQEQTFDQYAGRCAFLNEQNLCDIYIEAGEHMLCRTCKMYPRHVEEFENEREISLSLSCPVVARMLLDRKSCVCFRSAEDEKEEREDEEFDFFLYSALQDCRSVMITIMQNRERPAAFRMAKILALGHDVQNRINARRIFEINTVLERYQRPGADEKLEAKFSAWKREKDSMKRSRELLALLNELEVLDPSWQEQLAVYRGFLYEKGEHVYQERSGILQQPWMETESEQLIVYFLFTYFCGAVYDGDAFAKVKMAVVSTLIIRELEKAAQIGRGPKNKITLEDRARIAWRYSRELEHSDLNLNRMEELMNESEIAQLEPLLTFILE